LQNFFMSPQGTNATENVVLSLFSEGEVIVIATSAPEKRPGYRRDLLNCLCYPIGTSVRFSYRKRWIEEHLLSRWIEHHRSNTLHLFRNIPALIVFCDIPESPVQDFSFLPLRYAHIEGFEPLDILERAGPDVQIAVRFKLGRFIYFAPAEIEKQRDIWQTWMLSQEGKHPRPVNEAEIKTTKTNLVFTAKRFQEGQEEPEETSWVRLSEQISSARTMKGCSLFRLIGVYEASSHLNKKHVRLKEQYGHICYVFEAGKSYIINLQFYLDSGKARIPKTLVTHVSTRSILLSKPLIKNIGLSTEVEIIINTSKVYSSEIATLVIEDAVDLVIPNMARAEFVVLLQPERWLPLVVVLVAFGTFFTSVSPEMVKDFATLLHVGTSIASNTSLIAYSIKGLGSVLVAVGAYLGFRKLPSG
jgi:hypothetical protein